MSTTVSADVWKHSTRTGTALLILVSLADQANDEGWCWPSVDLIAERCRVSKRTAQRILSELELAGEVERVERRGSSTKYRIHVTGDSNVTGANLSPVTPVVAGGDTTVTGGVTSVSPRNIIESSEPSLGAKAPRKERNATTLPLTWKANNQHRQYALEKGLDLADEVTRFKDHHRAKGSRFKDWDAALRLWLANSARWSKPQRQEASHNGSWFPGA